MSTAMFGTQVFERTVYEGLLKSTRQAISYFEPRLTEETVKMAAGFSVVCLSASDHLSADVLSELKGSGTKLIALRSAGFNHVDMQSAKQLGLTVVRVPAYSPYAVAEFATMLILALNRKICQASARVHELNFSLKGLVGFDLNGKTVGIVGTGRIGGVMSKIMTGFGCNIICFDQRPDGRLVERLNVTYASLEEIYKRSDIITLHIPLSETTHHLINAGALAQMKKGSMLINTGRGGLIDTKALIASLKTGHLGAAGIDVYEEEESIFSRDLSGGVLQDDILARLLTFPNVLLTAHQAYLTHEALHNIAVTTLESIDCFESGAVLKNEIKI